MKTNVFFVVLILFIFSGISSVSQPGSLDLSFGNDGIVVSPITEYNEDVYATKVQADGKIVLAGYQEINNSKDMMVARYNNDGSPDLSFGNNGVVLIDFGTDSDAAWCMELQDDGKIVVAGYIYEQLTTVDDYAMARLNTDGSLDDSFGNGGLVTTDIDGYYDNAYDIAIQDDGKIILAGEAYIIDRRHTCLVRYNSDGSLDNSFGNAGVVIKTIGQVRDRARAVRIQSDGKIVAAGFFDDGAEDIVFVAQFNSDGTSDNSFGNSGVATLSIGSEGSKAFCMCMQPDDKSIIAGVMYKADQTMDALFVRHNTDGTLDNTFGNGSGIYLHAFNSSDVVNDIILQEDGKILAATGSFSYELVRLMPDGSKDYDFGTDGVVNTLIGERGNASSLCLDDNEKVVVGGRSDDGTTYNFSLARYHLDDEGGIGDPGQNHILMSVYPNPASEKISISYELLSDQMLSIDLIGLDGKKIKSFLKNQKRGTGAYTDDFQLPANIPAGVYFLNLKTEEVNAYKKLIIQ